MNRTWMAAAACVLAAAAAGCGGAKVASRWTSTPVKVDGALDDWQGDMKSYDDGALSAGFRNDGKDLYVAIAASDPRLARHLLMGGLTIWLDPHGGKARTLGVKFPIGGGMRSFDRGGDAEGSEPGGDGDEGGGWRGRGNGDEGGAPAEGGRRFDSSALKAFADRASYELEWIQNGETRRLGVDDAAARYGINAALRLDGGVLDLELAIPLASGPQAIAGIGVQDGRTIGLTFDSPAPQRRAGFEGRRGGGGMRGGFGRGGFGGGFGGEGGRGDGDMDGGFEGARGGPPGGGGRGAMASSLELRMKVVTATAPASHAAAATGTPAGDL